MLTDLRDIIDRTKSGDQAAFRKIVEEFRQPAFSVAFRITCNEEEARDAVQESFIKVWQNIQHYDMKRSFSTWLMKIVVNTSIDRKRQMNRHHIVSLDQAKKQIEAFHPDIRQEAETDNKEMAQLINWMAEGLPEKQQMVFILRDLQGMEPEEVCQVLNMSADSVKSNLYHARNAIREKLLRALK